MNETKIARYGNSLTVRLPAALARDLGFREGDWAQIRRLETGIAIERPGRARLEERLATVREQESERSTGSALGAERKKSRRCLGGDPRDRSGDRTRNRFVGRS